MAVRLHVVELENVRSEVKVIVDDNRPIDWTARLVKGNEFKLNVEGEEKTVYSMNLVQQPLLYLLASRFTDVENVEDEEEDRKALQKVFQPADYKQLMNFVDFTESVSKMMQFNNLDVENPRYVMKDDGIHDTIKED